MLKLCVNFCIIFVSWGGFFGRGRPSLAVKICMFDMHSYTSWTCMIASKATRSYGILLFCELNHIDT